MGRRQFLAGGLAIAAVAGCGEGQLPNTIFPPVPSVPPLDPPAAFVQPNVRSSVKGVLDIELSAQMGTNQLGSQTVRTRTFGGKLVGPTLRVKPGDTLRINLVNRLPPNADEHTVYPDPNTPHLFNGTNLHTHGLHVSPQGQSDNIFVDIAPGSSFQYEYKIPTNHLAGTFWYHPHRHGSSSMQLFGGMTGALIVEGELDNLPQVKQARDLVYMIGELNIEAATGMVPDFIPNIPPLGTYPLNQRFFMVNGQEQPTLQVQPGEVVRLRLVNGTVRATVPFAIDGHDLHVLSLDGITLGAVRVAGSQVLAPGNRSDVLIRAGAPGKYSIRKLENTATAGTGGGGVPDPEVVLGFLEVKGSPLVMDLPTTLASPLHNIPASQLTGFRTITFSQPGGPTVNLGPPGPVGSVTSNYSAFAVDGKRFDHTRIDHNVQLNAVEEWTLENTSAASHPFHIHVNPFLVMSVNGIPLPEPEWRDTINIPQATKAGGPGQVVIRHRFEDFVGLYVLHCHILLHEDLGMMQTVNVY